MFYEQCNLLITLILTGKKFTQCIKCHLTKDRRNKLRDHINAEHLGCIYPCSNCSYTAKYLQCLTSHHRNVHERIRYECTLCDHKVAKISRLYNHISKKHGVVKPKEHKFIKLTKSFSSQLRTQFSPENFFPFHRSNIIS